MKDCCQTTYTPKYMILLFSTTLTLKSIAVVLLKDKLTTIKKKINTLNTEAHNVHYKLKILSQLNYYKP